MSGLASRWSNSRLSVQQYDAITRRAIAELDQWSSWLKTHNVKGIIGEVGWPNESIMNGGSLSNANLWNSVADAYLSHATGPTVGLDYMLWVAGRDWTMRSDGTSYYLLGLYYANSTTAGAADIGHSSASAPIAERYFGRGTLSGVNMIPAIENAEPQGGGIPVTVHPSGTFSNVNPGVLGTDYWYPSQNDWNYLAARGVKCVKVGFRWERMQPTLLGSLASAELSALTQTIGYANTAGVKVVVALYNTYGYFIGSSSTAADCYPLSISGSVTANEYGDLWTRLATALKGTPGLLGYDLWNEPAMPSDGQVTGSNLVPAVATATFDTDLSGWSVKSAQSSLGVTISQVSSPTPHSGAGAMAITNGSQTGASVASAYTPYGFSCTPGQTFRASAFFRANTTSQAALVSIAFHNSAGTFINVNVGSQSVADNSGRWLQSYGVVTAPPNAASFAVAVGAQQCSAAGEIHYVDDVDIHLVTAGTAKTGAKVWEYLSQAAVTAIRATGATEEIWVESYQGGGGHSPAYGPLMFLYYHPTPWIVDPLNNVRYEAHHYWDHATSSGGLYASPFGTELTTAQSGGY